MFVVSIIDYGDERNFVATDLRVDHGDILIEAGGVRHLFRLADVIDIVPIGKERVEIARSPAFRCRLVS